MELIEIPLEQPKRANPNPNYRLNEQLPKSYIPLSEQIRKHDYFAELTKDFHSVYDDRFFVCALADLKQSDLLSETGFYPINIHKFSDLSGIPYHKAYLQVKELAIKYQTTQQSVRVSPSETRLTSLLYDIEVNEELKTIKVMWNSLLIPLISGTMPKGQWCKYDGRLVKASTHRSVAIGDYLQRHSWKLERIVTEGDNVLEVPTETLRQVSGCIDTYPEFKHFKASVLLPALRDINALTSLRLHIVKGNKRNVTFGVGK